MGKTEIYLIDSYVLQLILDCGITIQDVTSLRKNKRICHSIA